MKYALFLVAAFLSLSSFGQTDTCRIYNCPVLKPGFYSNYQEFISNSPSINIDFEITYLRISKNDSTIIGASYKLPENASLPGHIWGFCDGKDVFISFSPSLISKHYWRLESLGPHPFFSYPEKDIAAMGPPLMSIATVALTASQAPTLKLKTIDGDGKTSAASIKRLKTWLEPEPDLLAAFNRSGYKNPAGQGPESAPRYPDSYQGKINAIREYLHKLNQRLQQKAVSQSYIQNCETLGKASFFKTIKFGSQIPLDLYTSCSAAVKVGDQYYLIYDSITETCKRQHADLFTFSSFSFSDVKISTNKKGEIFSVDLWSPLNDADWIDSADHRMPDKFTRIFNELASRYGRGVTEEDKNDPDPVSRKYNGITRMTGWECTHMILRLKVTYGSDIRSMNSISLHIKSPKYETVEEVMLQQ